MASHIVSGEKKNSLNLSSKVQTSFWDKNWKSKTHHYTSAQPTALTEFESSMTESSKVANKNQSQPQKSNEKRNSLFNPIFKPTKQVKQPSTNIIPLNRGDQDHPILPNDPPTEKEARISTPTVIGLQERYLAPLTNVFSITKRSSVTNKPTSSSSASIPNLTPKKTRGGQDNPITPNNPEKEPRISTPTIAGMQERYQAPITNVFSTARRSSVTHKTTPNTSHAYNPQTDIQTKVPGVTIGPAIGANRSVTPLKSLKSGMSKVSMTSPPSVAEERPEGRPKSVIDHSGVKNEKSELKSVKSEKIIDGTCTVQQKELKGQRTLQFTPNKVKDKAGEAKKVRIEIATNETTEKKNGTEVEEKSPDGSKDNTNVTPHFFKAHNDAIASLELKDDPSLKKFKRGAKLGEGAYGEVYKCFCAGRFMAVKQVKIEGGGIMEKEIQSLRKEIELLKGLHHDNIVSYHGSLQDAETNYVYIFMEFMPGGCISQMLAKYGPFELPLVRKYSTQILQGLHYLHTQGVIHRDIKGANILVDGNGNAKLADLGACYRLESLVHTMAGMKSIKGSVHWMAPEIFNGTFGRRTDVWSFGCLMVEMLVAKPPWSDRLKELGISTMSSFMKHLVESEDIPPIPLNITGDARDFITICLERDPNKRPYCEQLLEHPFIKHENAE